MKDEKSANSRLRELLAIKGALGDARKRLASLRVHAASDLLVIVELRVAEALEEEAAELTPQPRLASRAE